jgi:aspartokinase-like uncharacterized kinase
MDLSVIKVGGSIATKPDKLRALCQKMLELSKHHRLVVVPGGGEFADTVRQFDMKFHLSKPDPHRMAVLGMDQYGLLLVDLMADSVAVNGLDDAEKALNEGKLAVFLPSTLIFCEDPLENSWDVTSDSIALYISHRLLADKLLLTTDVDGIYTKDPKLGKNARLIENVKPKELLSFGNRTSVDSALPKLLLQWQIDCYVINGFFPERVVSVLEGQKPVGTLICGSPQTV